MREGYPLRKYRLLDWFLIFITSALILQLVVTVFSSRIIQLFPTFFFEDIDSNEEIISNIIYFSSFLGTVLSLPLTLFVVYWRKIPFFNRKHLTQEESLIVRGLSKEDWRFLFWYIPSSYTVYLLGNGLLARIFGEAEAVNQIAVETMFEYVPIWQMFLMIVVVAPIVEELLFRGLVLFSSGRLETTWLRVIISAILFGAAHSPTNIQSLYTYVGMGFILAYAAKRTQSVEAPIFYHFLNNLIGFIAILSI